MFRPGYLSRPSFSYSGRLFQCLNVTGILKYSLPTFSMKNMAQALASVTESIREAEHEFGRPSGSVALLAVSKYRTAAEIREAAGAGQKDFGENYAQEAVAKIEALDDRGLRWHFIGPIQSNKTGDIAAHFHWVHSVDRAKIARRLDAGRPDGDPPLNVCIQMNIDAEDTKSGVGPEGLRELAAEVASLPRLRLRGLMALPAPASGFAAQRRPFRQLREHLEALNRDGFTLDTLSMGTTADLRAAIAEGATLVRVGTGLFGPRPGAE